MASNNEYKRYFIILQEDDKGYEMSPGKLPTGYVKIEVKNSKVRLNTFVQNVKHEEGIEYRLILVASGKKLAVDAGKILIDSSGRGELSHEFESDNVLKSGLNIADFTVAAVSSGVSIPLSGYTGRDKLEWKGKYDIVNRPKDHEASRIDKKITVEEIVPEIPKPPVQPAPVMEPMPEPEPVIVEAPVPKPEPVIVEVPAPKPEPVVVEIPEPAPMPMPMPEPAPEPAVVEKPHIYKSKVEIGIIMPKCPPMAPIEEPCDMAPVEAPCKMEPIEAPCEIEAIEVPCEVEKKKVEYEDIHQYYCDDDDSDSDSDSDDRPKHKKHHEHELSPYYSGAMYSKLKRLVRKLRRYEPFEKERDCDWFKVGDDIYEINNVAVPYMGYMMPLGYPFMSEGCSLMADRKGYILGVKYDDEEDDDDRKLIKYIFFGVPAIYSKKNHYYYRSRGFTEFRPHKSREHGYFIMCLDIRSGMLCKMS